MGMTILVGGPGSGKTHAIDQSARPLEALEIIKEDFKNRVEFLNEKINHSNLQDPNDLEDLKKVKEYQSQIPLLEQAYKKKVIVVPVSFNSLTSLNNLEDPSVDPPEIKKPPDGSTVDDLRRIATQSYDILTQSASDAWQTTQDPFFRERSLYSAVYAGRKALCDAEAFESKAKQDPRMDPHEKDILVASASHLKEHIQRLSAQIATELGKFLTIETGRLAPALLISRALFGYFGRPGSSFSTFYSTFRILIENINLATALDTIRYDQVHGGEADEIHLRKDPRCRIYLLIDEISKIDSASRRSCLYKVITECTDFGSNPFLFLSSFLFPPSSH